MERRTLWQEAEEAALRYMRSLGFSDAVLTAGGADHGLDVSATGAVAQVKAQSSAVGRPDVQRLVGAALDSPAKLFFSISGYSAGAIAFADTAGVALFTLDSNLAPFAVNDIAHSHVQRGIEASSAWTEARPRAPDFSRVAPKVLVALAAFVAVIVAGPIVFAVGREALRRAGQSLRPLPISDRVAMRRAGTAAAGAIGTVLLLSVVVQQIAWSLTNGTPRSGTPGLGALVGALVGVGALAALDVAVRGERLHWLPVPDVLGDLNRDHAQHLEP
jgi:hypothetical protein